MVKELKDLAAERAVLAAAINYGGDAYADVADIVTSRTFSLGSNQTAWACIEHICKDNPQAVIDYPSIMAAAHALNVHHVMDKPGEQEHLRSIMNMPVRRETMARLAGRIRQLEVARLLDNQLDFARANLYETDGDEPIDRILARVEAPIFDFTALLSGSDNRRTRRMGDGAEECLTYAMDNPREMVGISTGLRRYDLSIGGGCRANAMDVIAARPKTGKAQPLDAIVYTPKGPVRMGDVRPGVLVNTPTGTSMVTAVYPQGVVDIYRVTFNDGDSTECCLNHLWEVRNRRSKKTKVLRLEEFKDKLLESDGRPRWIVRLPIECRYDGRNVPMNPYLLGALIGDGMLKCNRVDFTNTDQELLEEVGGLLDNGYQLKPRVDSISYGVTKGAVGKGKKNDYLEALRQLGLHGCGSHDKFVPEVYKYNTRAVREQLLQGLMDTDGCANTDGTVEYSSASKRLAYDVKEMVQSLGGLCKVTRRTTKCDGKSFVSYRCNIRLNNPSGIFWISRKKSRCRSRKKPPLHRTIVKVEHIGQKEAQCISLADSDGLYLTDHHIVTHNTFLVDTMGLYIAGQGIPVWNGDTEMEWEEHLYRVAANLAGLPIDDIERGVCGKNPVHRRQVIEAARRLKDMPYYHRALIGEAFEETLAHMRRWVVKDVGLQENGKAKPCVIIYDYLKLMSPDALSKGDMSEWQMLGFIATALKNFAARYGVPIICFAQLNRDGIDKEDTSAIAASDRIIWFCTSFSIFKWKTDDERQEERGSKVRYTHKLIPVVSRFGKGIDDKDYINIHANYSIARIEEGPLRSELAKGLGNTQPKGVVSDEHSEKVTDQEPIDF